MSLVIHDKALIRPKGEIFLRYKKDGNLLFEASCANMVVNNGLLVMAGLVASKIDDYKITQFGFGDGTVAVAAGDTSLSGDNYKIKALDLATTNTYGSSSARLAFAIDFDADIAGQDMGLNNPWLSTNPFTIREFALFSANNTMFNRLIWTGPDLVLSTGIQIEGFFQITILTL